ncbi:MAG: hypothetical protein RSE18_00145 [Acinetobacter sp.]
MSGVVFFDQNGRELLNSEWACFGLKYKLTRNSFTFEAATYSRESSYAVTLPLATPIVAVICDQNVPVNRFSGSACLLSITDVGNGNKRLRMKLPANVTVFVFDAVYNITPATSGVGLETFRPDGKLSFSSNVRQINILGSIRPTNSKSTGATVAAYGGNILGTNGNAVTIVANDSTAFAVPCWKSSLNSYPSNKLLAVVLPIARKGGYAQYTGDGEGDTQIGLVESVFRNVNDNNLYFHTAPCEQFRGTFVNGYCLDAKYAPEFLIIDVTHF